jgi:hypothetical protein
MTVRCPRCGTLYRRPTHGGGESTFRCARCRHVFEDERPEPALARDGSAEDDDGRDEPAFVFEDGDAPGDDAEPELPPLRVRRPAPASRPTAAPERASRGSTLGFAVRTWFVVCLGYFVLSVWLYTHPEDARTVLARVPLIGTALVETRVDPAEVQLTNVRGEYRRVKGDRLVFLVTGTAVNNSTVHVKRIQIEGRLVGARELRQVVFCCAAPRDVGDLGLHELAMLQSLEPPPDWALAPGEQADFLLVFSQPPPALREFSAEVVAVRTESRRRGSGEPTRHA